MFDATMMWLETSLKDIFKKALTIHVGFICLMEMPLKVGAKTSS